MDSTSNDGLHLYSYWRSSAAWRVRCPVAPKSLTTLQTPWLRWTAMSSIVSA